MRAKLLKFVLLLTLSLFLTSATVILGAIPLRALRQAYGRGAYLLGCGFLVVVSYFVGGWALLLLMLAQSLLIGTYSELEEAGIGIFAGSLAAVLTLLSLVAVGGAISIKKGHIDLFGMIKTQVQQVTERVVAMNPTVIIKTEALMGQVPSAIVILFILSLGVALIWERNLLKWFKLKGPEALRSGLMTFRTPDVLIWATIAVLVGAYGQSRYPLVMVVSENIINILFVIFFFQGLAVVSQYFRSLRVGIFWQGFWYILIVVQLFPLLALVGFSDYWLDYRSRLLRRVTEMKRNF